MYVCVYVCDIYIYIYICMGDIRGGGQLISSVMESLMSAQAWLYGVLDGTKYPQTKANTIKRSGVRSSYLA